MFGINYTKYFGTFVPINIDGLLQLSIDTKFFIIASIGTLFSVPWWRAKCFSRKRFSENSTFASIISILGITTKYLALGALLVLCYASLADNSYNPFIYFRF